jgi:hypothetical protein
MKSTGFFKTVLLTGLFVGLMDLIWANVNQWVRTGKYADKMLNYIAGGALGVDNALAGGNAVQLLGLFFHFFIAFSFTFFFFWIFPRVRFLSFNKYLIGYLYGIFVTLVMGQIVLPLSRLHGWRFSVSGSIIDWIVFGAVFGIPVVYNTYKYYDRT